MLANQMEKKVTVNINILNLKLENGAWMNLRKNIWWKAKNNPEYNFQIEEIRKLYKKKALFVQTKSTYVFPKLKEKEKLEHSFQLTSQI